MEEYELMCAELGEVPCTDPDHHEWVFSDEDTEYCYCEKCGCVEY